MWLVVSALLLGFVHGLGADHLLAIAALATGERSGAAARARALGVAVRFATGHALFLAVGTSTVILLGWTVPVAVEQAGERLGGALLVGLGAFGLWAAATRRVYGHVHGDLDEPRPHWHLHVGRTDRHPTPAAHVSHLPTLIGALFAVSSLRTLSLLAPLGVGPREPTVLTVLGLVLLFGLGILTSMSLFGVLLARTILGGVGHPGPVLDPAHVAARRSSHRIADGLPIRRTTPGGRRSTSRRFRARDRRSRCRATGVRIRSGSLPLLFLQRVAADQEIAAHERQQHAVDDEDRRG